MADHNTVTHPFVSPVQDDANTNLIRPQANWNKEHVFNGGATGRVLFYDPTFSDHIDFKHFPTYDLKIDFGAKGDGSTDDTTAVQTAASTGGRIFVGPGTYKITAGITLSVGCVFQGVGVLPGNVVTVGLDPALRPVFEHHFNGDFFTILGVNGSIEYGMGIGLQDILLRQAFGDGSTIAGRAINIVATGDTYRPSFIRLANLNIENGTGKNNWTSCLTANGNATTDNTKGVRHVWISNSRLVTGPNSTNAISLNCAVQFSAQAVQMEALSGNTATFEITGSDASHASFNTFISDCFGQKLSIDRASAIYITNPHFDDFITTANSGDVLFLGGHLTNQPTILGTGINVFTNVNGIFNLYSNNLQILNGAGTAALSMGSNGVLLEKLASVPRKLALTYSASMTPDASLANTFTITVTNGAAFTIQNPINITDGQRFVITFINTSGGAMGAITLGSAIHIAGAFTNPATGFNRSLEFLTVGTVHYEQFRSAADVPN